ncbi:TadA family conjugal transfer-associated ATPase [Brachybacterium sp. EF45031]|uniref:TadA family conjugal transfer-associated ATPase n=1 Tax=Brachybacterium sillae TaxID=2810536 RepID=UPI00217E83DC|nr:TadA family conjugal transfer-associated ATPase [Brachybacterium sillae]MCS6712149.1 TadA family conjugal transfer-associated ATPase [Brachybacterium sillae]
MSTLDLVRRVREDVASHPGPVDAHRVSRILREAGDVVGGPELLRLTGLARDHVQGLGPLQPLVVPGVTDVLVNPDGSVWVEDTSGLHPADCHLDADDARDLAVRLAVAAGRRLDDAQPCVDAQLPGGARLHAVLPPVSDGGAVISLRFPSGRRLDLADLCRSGMVDTSVEPLLRAVITRRAAFLISGGTGTGKTTLLGAMLALAPATERLLVLEDSRELQIDHPHTVALQSRQANTEGRGAVPLAQLVREALRMRPDRIILGECRGAEVRELLQALNTGHEGGCATVHANSAGDVPARLEALGALGGLDAPTLAAQAVSALDVVLHLERRGGLRRLTQVATIGRGADGRLRARIALDLSGRQPRPGPGWEEIEQRLRLDPPAAPTGRRRA